MVSSMKDEWIPPGDSFYDLDIDVIKNNDLVGIRKEKFKKSDLIGAELIGIAEDDLGDILRFKLKDGRILVMIQDEDKSYLVMTEESCRDNPASL